MGYCFRGGAEREKGSVRRAFCAVYVKVEGDSFNIIPWDRLRTPELCYQDVLQGKIEEGEI